MTFLGHKCTSKGLLPDDSKIETIKNYPIPTNKDEVKRFVAIANYYRRFIKDFALLAAPLNQLISKNVYFSWDDKYSKAFECVRLSLMSSKLLQYPDFSKSFVITLDAWSRFEPKF